MNKYKLLLGASILAFFSCVDDEGSYRYTSLNEVHIEDVASTYNVMAYVDDLTITPKISGTEYGENTDDYEYTWEFCESEILSSTHKHTVISHEKDLNWTVELAPKSYTLYFYVKDKNTELETHVSTTVNVSSSFTRGFLVLGDLPEQNNLLEMDMLTMPLERDTTMVEDAFDNSEMQLKNPSKLIFAGKYVNHTKHNQALWMLTEDDSYRLNTGDNFDLLGDFNGLRIFETDIPHTQPMHMVDMFPHQRAGAYECASRSYRGYITDDMATFQSIMSLEYLTTPCNHYSTSPSTYFHPYPYGFTTGSATSMYNGTAIFYDMDNDCFALISSVYSSYVSKILDGTTDPFPYDGKELGRKMVYGTNIYYSNYAWACTVMKDNDNNFFIYRMRFPTYYYGSSIKYFYPIDLSKVTDFDKASHYAFSHARMAVTYSVGSKLYQYDYSRDMLTCTDLGSEITYLEDEYSSTGTGYRFLAATYDSQKKGEIYFIHIGDDPNQVETIIDSKWPTRLRVKDMCWKNCE